MRKWLIGFVLVLAAIAVVLIWPYRFEQPRLTIANNPMVCEMSVDVPSGWPMTRPLPFTLYRMKEPVDARLSLFRCPGAREARPLRSR